ncbi:MAG: class I SAM-dependent methyltransferase [Planctomycetia bacterium]|nr:class I SAM-dependent methyltransferase [Planctomycetia bacterium]
MAQAYTLYESLIAHHPDAVFAVALCDEVGDFDLNSFPFRIIPLRDLGIDDLDSMIARYNITELNTAIKPFVFNYLHEEAAGAPVIYFDPDILVTSPLEELVGALDAGADCVLTPHMLEPSEWAEMHEGRILQFGIYNLGFVALRGTPEVQRICHWWGRRLQTDCVIDVSRGLFVDQKWADLFPAFIENTYILRHPGYNVAYWNLSHRRITIENGAWCVNGLPLRFFHFSGSVMSEPTVFSRHSTFYVRGGLRALDDLFDTYCETVRANGFHFYQAEFPYSYSWSGPSGENQHTPEGASAKKLGPGTLAASIFSVTNFPHLPLLKAESQAEYIRKTSILSDVESARRGVEDALVPKDDPFRISGYCVVCGRQDNLVVSSMYSPGNFPDGRPIPNWREHLNCSCGLTNRLRATLHVMQQHMPPGRSDRIYLTEQATPLFTWFAQRYENVSGSEYFGPDQTGGATVKGFRHEDIQNLSFPDKSFDLIISLEVLEHVPFPDSAFRELRRCLRDDGAALITAPFKNTDAHDEIRARLTEKGEIEHFMPPEYHGNPVDLQGGALCFRYFGWDVLDRLKGAGFSRAEVVFYWSRRFGYLGNTNAIILAYA